MPDRKDNTAYTRNNHVKIVRGGAEYFSHIEQIADNARYSLHLQTYIYDDDETGNKVAQALIRAAKRNVLVYLLVDGYASQHLSKEFISGLRDAGVRFDFFQPLFKSGTYYIGRRLHHKVIVADGLVGMVAGINISDRYNDISGNKAWLDWAVYAEGEVAGKLNDVCVKIWNRPIGREKCPATNKPSYARTSEDCLARVIRNDWVFTKTEITRTYRKLFNVATSEITLMTSYFWPSQRLLKRMIAAAARGVKVRLILTAKADVPLSKYTERYLYQRLLRNNIEIYEYQESILHGKAAVCDNQWFTLGSYNVNNISARASVELNIDINNFILSAQMRHKMQDIIESGCVQITGIQFTKKNSLLKKLGYYLSYRLVHFIFFLFTFYFVQRHDRT